MKNTLLLDALKGENHAGRPPIWLMRQAGRYMPQYMELRRRHSLLDMFHTPEIAAEVTFLPIDLLDVDAAIIFSDILVIIEALGLGLQFKENVGPIIERPLKTADDIAALPPLFVNDKLAYVAEAMKLVKKEISIPLLGFSGAPFTLASYMIEGGSSRDLKKTRQWLYSDPESFHTLLDSLTDIIIEYLKMQIEAGADAVQIFDTWANILTPQHFEELSSHYLKKIVKALSPHPVVLFSKGTTPYIPSLVNAAPAAISIDWSCDISYARKMIPKNIALQGNLDPYVLYASQDQIQVEVQRLMDTIAHDPSYIFNLGHGINLDIPFENVKFLVDYVKSFQHAPC